MKRCIPVLMLAVLAAAGVAWGQATPNNYGTVQFNLTVPNDPTMVLSANGDSEDVYIGPYTYNVTGATNGTSNFSGNTTLKTALGNPHTGNPPSTASPTVLTGFCVDFVTNIDVGPTYTASVVDLGSSGSLRTAGGISATTAANEIKELMTEYENASTSNNPYKPTVSTASTALQLAIWAVVTDPTTPTNVGDSVNAGGNTNPAFYVPKGSTGKATNTGDPVQIANAWLQGMGSTTADSNLGVYALVPTTGEQIQSIVLAFTPGGNQGGSVPEPMGLISLASMGLIGLPIALGSIYRRRRRG